MAKIQYNTKKLRVNTPPTPEELFSFGDANEIKASVNALYDGAGVILATPTEPQAESILLKKAIEGEDDMKLGLSADSLSMKGDSFDVYYDWSGQTQTFFKEAYINPSGVGFQTIDKENKISLGKGWWNGNGLGFDSPNVHAYFSANAMGASDIANGGGFVVSKTGLNVHQSSSYINGNANVGLDGLWFSNDGSYQGGSGYHTGAGVGVSNTNGQMYANTEAIGFNANTGGASINSYKLSFFPDGAPANLGYRPKPTDLTTLTKLNFLVQTGTTGTQNIYFPSESGTLARLEDLPSAPDLSGYIKNLPVYGGEVQNASININGGISIANEFGFAQFFGGGLSVGNTNGAMLVQLSGIQANGAWGTLMLNSDRLFSYQTENGLSYELTPSYLKFGNGLVDRTLELASTASGSFINQLPSRNGVLATLDDIPAAPDLSTYISMYGFQEQTGYLTLKNWLTFKKINSWQNSTNAGNLSYSDTHRWVFMSSSDSTKNVGFEILPSDTRTVIRLTLPIGGGTMARLEDIPSTANFATLNGYNTFTANNTFSGYSNFQGASFQGDVNVNSGKRTTLGGGVDVYSDFSIYSGVGRITINAAYMGTTQSHNITLPNKSGTIALTSDLALNYITSPNGTKWYVNDDGTLVNTDPSIVAG